MNVFFTVFYLKKKLYLIIYGFIQVAKKKKSDFLSLGPSI